ncbi:MAG: hypothetical protein HONBIEJF_01387 [Fimbriimonadaceae bacterium]|nr:hypothetical protein [Fimbriimonadaceae bacterium]
MTPLRGKRLGDLLLDSGLITSDQLEKAIRYQAEKRILLGQAIHDLGYAPEIEVLKVVARQFDVDPWDMTAHPPDPSVRDSIDGEICRRFGVIPLQRKEDRLWLGMRNPNDLEVLDLVQGKVKERVIPVLVSERLLKIQLVEAYGDTMEERVGMLVQQALDESVGHRAVYESQETAALTEEDTAPVVELVNQVLGDAIRSHASDIHFEPRQNQVDIRFRIDGRLVEVRQFPKSLHGMVCARIKIMAELDIVEHRLPQDGRFSAKIDNRTVDLRISVLPHYHGPRIVLRILDRAVALKKVSELGLSDHNVHAFTSLIRKPYGMILLTGPTGSGKTTTLYAALNSLKDVATNIMTCEDPVEYDIEGINQSQVNEKVGLNFASQLRAILRQDPDIVLVGEIRDKETADTAIRAALTGHLVLSTLHANDAPSAVPRLLDMGIDPFLLSSSLIGVISQRLLRRNCPHCATSRAILPHELALLQCYLGSTRVETLKEGTGCPRCKEGFRGRTGIHEVMVVTPEVGHAIADQRPVDALRSIAREYGYRTMQHDSLERVVGGETTLAEAQRLVFFDEFQRTSQEHFVARPSDQEPPAEAVNRPAA